MHEAGGQRLTFGDESCIARLSRVVCPSNVYAGHKIDTESPMHKNNCPDCQYYLIHHKQFSVDTGTVFSGF